MNIAAGNVIVAAESLPGKVWINADTFYTVAPGGNVALWNAEDGDAIQLGVRHPGTSGKSAATIANDLLNDI